MQMQTVAPIMSLTPDLFLNMLKAGAEQVISSEYELNQLNVYPVTDRDTGSNLAALMRYLLAQSYETTELPLLLNHIADSALVGACGNSGMIFAAFLDGFAAGRGEVKDNQFLTHTFLICLRSAVKQAYFSVSEPVEGTMLTMMTAFLKAFDTTEKKSIDFIVVFDACIAEAEIALRETEHQLAVLEENHVIDAGALGFFLFMQGMRQYLINPEEKPTIVSHLPVENHHAHDAVWHEEKSRYSYCMETLLRSANLDIEKAKEKLNSMADSIVINKSPSYTKIHLHTNDIQHVTHYLKQFGIVQHQKIDNMKKQWEISHKRKHRIALVTDSAADIPEDWVRSEQIHVIPMQVRLGEHALLDRMTVNLHDIYHAVDNQGLSAKSATPSVEVVARYLNYLSSHYDSAIVFSCSAKLSSTYQLLSKQAALISSIPIDVIDTESVSAGAGLLVMAAARYIAAGDAHEVVVKKMNALREDTHLFVMVNDLDTLTRSGRIPHSFGSLAKWAKFKPIITFKNRGKLSFSGFGVGKNLAWKRLLKSLKQTMLQCEMQSFAIVHTAAFDEAKKFADYLQYHLGIKIDFIREASSAIGLHTGRGSIGFATSKALLR